MQGGHQHKGFECEILGSLQEGISQKITGVTARATAPPTLSITLAQTVYFFSYSVAKPLIQASWAATEAE